MKKNMIQKVAVYLCGLVILCLGVVLNMKTGLGVAAINGIPYVIANTTEISLGNAIFIMYCSFILIQCIIKKRVDILTILQLPVSLFFGKMVDFINTNFFLLEADSIYNGLVMLAMAIVLVALGTTLVVSQNLVPNAPDGIVQVIADKLGWSFGKCKLYFDVVCVCTSAGLSVVLANRIIGIGIGTLCSMALTGTLCTFFKELFKMSSKGENHVKTV